MDWDLILETIKPWIFLAWLAIIVTHIVIVGRRG